MGMEVKKENRLAKQRCFFPLSLRYPYAANYINGFYTAFPMLKHSCPSCSSLVENSWQYCPSCGETLFHEAEEEDEFSSFFTIPSFDMFENIHDHFREFDRLFEEGKRRKKSGKPAIKSSGISIQVSNVSGRKPEVKVHTFGDYKKYEDNIKRRLGVAKTGGQPTKREKSLPSPPSPASLTKAARQAVAPPSKTEEPASRVRRLSDRIIYEFDMPELKSEKDIRITQLQNTTEIKAFAEDKAYFKLLPLTLPVLGYRVENGKLLVEFEPLDVE